MGLRLLLALVLMAMLVAGDGNNTAIKVPPLCYGPAVRPLERLLLNIK